MERVKSDLYYTIDACRVGSSGVRIYKIVLKHFQNNQNKADDFMLSKDGGYTDSELRRIKYLINHHQNNYKRKS